MYCVFVYYYSHHQCLQNVILSKFALIVFYTIINVVVRTYQIKENGMFSQLIGIFLIFIRLGDIRFIHYLVVTCPSGDTNVYSLLCN